jgi:hypothetical protein
MRKSLVLIALLSALSAWAQTPPIERDGQLDPRKNQKIEHLTTEDKDNRIDEVRVGGQTQSVTVQPKHGAPAYEMQPNDMARTRPAGSRDGFAERPQRVWNVFGF